MARFVTRINSPLPPDEAFAFMADLTNFAQWDPGVSSAEQVEGDGPGPGAAFDVDVDSVNGTLTLRYRITTYVHPNVVVAEAETKLLRSLDRITVVPTEAGGSIVTYDAELTLRGALGLADPLLGIAFDRIGRRAEDGLRQALDGEVIQASQQSELQRADAT